MKNPILLLLLAGLTLAIFSTGCAERGCTDPSAENFDPFAEVDNGDCIYRGCTDPNSTNYNPKATLNDGTCQYSGQVSFWSSVSCCAIEVSLNGQKVDTIEVYYNGNPGCVNGEGIVRLTRPVGNYAVHAQTITGDTSQFYIWEDTISIEQGDCLTYEFSL